LVRFPICCGKLALVVFAAAKLRAVGLASVIAKGDDRAATFLRSRSQQAQLGDEKLR